MKIGEMMKQEEQKNFFLLLIPVPKKRIPFSLLQLDFIETYFGNTQDLLFPFEFKMKWRSGVPVENKNTQ
jgi:hypothetical protein